MSDVKLVQEKDGPIGWIIFNQPEKCNAVSQEMAGCIFSMVLAL